MRAQTEALTQLTQLLATVAPAAQATERLHRHTRKVLTRPLWRASATTDGPSFPTVEEGFVSPRFRTAVTNRSSRLGDESWWGIDAAALGVVVLPSMVAAFAGRPDLMPAILAGLKQYQRLAWAQVRPHELWAAVATLHDRDPGVRDTVASYVLSRNHDEFDGEDAEALERLKEACR